MKTRYLPQYAIALAILGVGLLIAGVPVQTLLIALIVLTCPLMMLLMMAGMHGGGHGGSQEDPESRPGADPVRRRSGR